jgi:hypothetical protein
MDLWLDFDPFAAGEGSGVVEFKLLHGVLVERSKEGTNVWEMERKEDMGIMFKDIDRIPGAL